MGKDMFKTKGFVLFLDALEFLASVDVTVPKSIGAFKLQCD
jgi:hypothetical protein